MRFGFAQALGIGLVALLWGLPLAASFAAFAAAAFDLAAWNALLHHPQLPEALVLSLWTGTAGLALALAAALLVTMGFYGTARWQKLQAFAAAGLSIPHLAFAIGFGFFIMPSGFLARLFVGGSEPPLWVTAQDPLGLALIACLALKETPFLIAMIWSVLAQGDIALALTGHWQSARSLGHGPGSVWFRVLLPQILARLRWPIALVWVYGVSVTDMALVIGPTQPPTLAVIVWSDLNNAAAEINGRGSAGAMLMTLVLAAGAALAWLSVSLAAGRMRRVMTAGPSPLGAPKTTATLLLAAMVAIYGFVLVMLAGMSLAAYWPYPQLIPGMGFAAWHSVLANNGPAVLSLLLALGSSALALGLAVLWLEIVPARSDRALTIAAVASLALPALAVASGQYRFFLDLHLTGTLSGLFLAHFTPVFAYVFIVLKGSYRAFDPRFEAVAHGLNSGRLRFLARVKAPLLKAAMAMAMAVGFAVSMVQFVPAQLIAAGRYSTLPMEAVTLASGGARPLTAAYALALAVLPMLAFLLAQMIGRPRWRQTWS